jgi:hypothetical protein
MAVSRRTPFKPNLVNLANHIGGWTRQDSQNAISHTIRNGRRIFAPFPGEDKVAYFPSHDPEYE